MVAGEAWPDAGMRYCDEFSESVRARRGRGFS